MGSVDFITALLLLVVFGLGSVLAVALGLWLMSHMLRSQNRVSPSARTPAPSAWLASPSVSARFHRRLRNAIVIARASAAAAPSLEHLAEVATDLEASAVTLDEQLVLSYRLPAKARRAQLGVLAAQLQQIEKVASQLSVAAARTHASLSLGHSTELEELSRRLEVLEQARREVADIEAAHGVHRSSPFAR